MSEPLKHLLPPLRYDVAALEPHIDAHHDKHHAHYVAWLIPTRPG